MGMYTEVYFRAEINREAGLVMKALAEGQNFYMPDHAFFATPRSEAVFGGASAYFPGESFFRYIEAGDDEFMKYGPKPEEWCFVTLRSSLKNYDDEIELFFDWVTPYVREGGGGGENDFIGYSLYETDEAPKLYYAVKS